MKISLILMSLLIMLTGCTNSIPEPTAVTQYEVITPDVPDELLTALPAPSPNTLKGVEVCKGTEQLKQYGTALLVTNYTNTQKINALKELLK